MKKSRITLESLVESYKLSKNKEFLFDNAVTLLSIIKTTKKTVKVKIENFCSSYDRTITLVDEDTVINAVINYCKEKYNFLDYEVFKLDDVLCLAFVSTKVDGDRWKIDKQLIQFAKTEDPSYIDFKDVSVYRLFHDDDPSDETQYCVDFINIQTDEPILDFCMSVDKEDIDNEDGIDLHVQMCKDYVREYTGLCWHSVFFAGDFIYVSFVDMVKVVNDGMNTVEIFDGTQRVIINKNIIFWLVNRLMEAKGFEHHDFDEDD